MVIVIHICDSDERAQVSLKECGGISAERLCWKGNHSNAGALSCCDDSYEMCSCSCSSWVRAPRETELKGYPFGSAKQRLKGSMKTSFISICHHSRVLMHKFAPNCTPLIYCERWTVKYWTIVFRCFWIPSSLLVRTVDWTQRIEADAKSAVWPSYARSSHPWATHPLLIWVGLLARTVMSIGKPVRQFGLPLSRQGLN